MERCCHIRFYPVTPPQELQTFHLRERKETPAELQSFHGVPMPPVFASPNFLDWKEITGSVLQCFGCCCYLGTGSQPDISLRGDFWVPRTPMAKADLYFWCDYVLFPKYFLSRVEEKRGNSTDSGSKGGELLLGSCSSLPCSCKVLSTKELQGSIKSELDCQGQHSSLTICVPKVKHVLNEARVLCFGQSWILNSSVFCSFCWKKWGCCFFASWDILKTSSLEMSKSNDQKENVTYQWIRSRVINFPTYCEPGVPMAFTSCAGKKKEEKNPRNLSSVMLLIRLMLLFL